MNSQAKVGIEREKTRTQGRDKTAWDQIETFLASVLCCVEKQTCATSEARPDASRSQYIPACTGVALPGRSARSSLCLNILHACLHR
jgi:hypothetical protein